MASENGVEAEDHPGLKTIATLVNYTCELKFH